MKSLSDSGRKMENVLPKGITWYRNPATEFIPDKSKVQVGSESIAYDYLVVAMGIQLKYNQIKGLPEAFNTLGVCSNYSALYVDKTLECLKNFKKGS